MSAITLDHQYCHSKNVNLGYTHDGTLADNRLGEFCGSPIVAMDTLGAEVDQLVEIQRTIAINQALGTDTYTAEVLPGEVVCEDGVVRRATTAEAQGESFYVYEEPKDTQRVSVEQGRVEAMKGGLVYFRPDRRVGTGEFALVNTKEEL